MVYLREGTYYLADTLEFTRSDAWNVTYAAYKNESVRISGAALIGERGWTESQITNLYGQTVLFGKHRADGMTTSLLLPHDTVLTLNKSTG